MESPTSLGVCHQCKSPFEFETSMTGQTASCPTCGAQTILNSGPATARARPSALPGGEEEFFNEGGILITRTRVVANGKVFVLAGVTSAEVTAIPANRILLGGGAILIGLFLVAINPIVAAIGAVAVFALGCVLYKDEYALVLHTAGGEVRASRSTDQDLVNRAFEAVQEAIVSRG